METCFKTPGEKKSSGQGSFGGNEFPEDLPKDAESEFGIGGGEVEATDEAADFFLGGSGGAPLLGATWTRFQVATRADGIEQERSEALEIGGGCGDGLGRMRHGLGIAREFIEADSYGLAEVHGPMLLASGDAEQPMAVAEVFIRKTTLL
jgi:hypothetical protein